LSLFFVVKHSGSFQTACGSNNFLSTSNNNDEYNNSISLQVPLAKLTAKLI